MQDLRLANTKVSVITLSICFLFGSYAIAVLAKPADSTVSTNSTKSTRSVEKIKSAPLKPTEGLSTKPSITSINKAIDAHIAENGSPSVSVAIIKNRQLVHLSAAGLSDVKNKIPANIHTSYAVGSVSKTVTNLAVFKLVEQGKIDLNADINQFLPFKVQNPHIVNDKITVAQLLNHRAGIFDNKRFLFALMLSLKGDHPQPLKEFVANYLLPTGQYYSEDNYRQGASAKDYQYSNVGYAILGLIVEHASKMPFNEYCNNEIFTPLAMNDTRWFLKELPIEQTARLYVEAEVFKLTGYWGIPDYPSGSLRSSIVDFTKLVQQFISLESHPQILKQNTLEQIVPTVIDDGSARFTWFKEERNSQWFYQHDGAVFGGGANVLFNRASGDALIIFANNDDFPWKLHDEIFNLAFQ